MSAHYSPDDVHDEASFLEFVRHLAQDRAGAARSESPSTPASAWSTEWQNSTIESFLEAACSWAEDSGFGRRQGLDDSVSPWRRMAVFLHAGKIYE